MALADFHVIISDTGIILNDQTNRDHKFQFDLGTWAEHNYRAILMWFRRLDQPANNLEFRWVLNGKPVRHVWGVRPDQQGTMHEVLEHGLTRDNLNDLRVEIVSGTGAVQIHDVVLFIRRNI